MASQMRKIKPDPALKAEKWQLPTMDSAQGGIFRNEKEPPQEPAKEESGGIPTVDEIEQWRQQAQEEGFQQGYDEGRQQAQREAEELGRQLRRLIEFFDQPLNALNEEIEQQLNLMVVSLAQQLVRREIRTEPGEIIGLIREAVQLLPASSRQIRLALNPEDAELVRKTLQLDENEEELSWKLIEDPMITRGGCEIRSDKSVINATLENRLQALAASVLGGERIEDQADATD